MLAGGSERWEQRLPSALSALIYRDYRLIWIGQMISNVGSSMQQLGLGWLIVELAQKASTPDLVPVYLGLDRAYGAVVDRPGLRRRDARDALSTTGSTAGYGQRHWPELDVVQRRPVHRPGSAGC
jgi:hypothetical protein